MSQIPLNLITRLPYTRKNFICHEGVKELFRSVSTLFMSDTFHLITIQGLPRTGKTHLSIALADQAGEQSRFPRIVEARSGAGNVFSEELSSAPFASLGGDVVYLVDDADIVLCTDLSLPASQSGPFVSFVEEIRKKRGKICLFMTKGVEEIAADDHVMSRLRAGTYFEIGPPGREEVKAIVKEIAYQHGLKFDSRELGFIERRVGGEIPAIEQFLQRLEHLTKTLGRPIDFLALKDAV